MLTILTLALLAQTQPAIRRSTPLSDDPGMVVRQAGPISINGTIPSTDGGFIGIVNQGVGLTDGGSWAVTCISGCSGSSGGGGGWVPDGGPIGTVNVSNFDGGVFITSLPPVSVTGSVAVTGPLTDAQLRATPVNVVVTNYDAGVWVASSALPTGASTSALQTTGNTSLSSIDTKTPALGQTTMAGSTPVVIASNQSSVPINDNSGSITVDGTVAATQSGTWSTRTQDGAGNALASSTSAPAGTEQALIVRNIPSGTQTVSGTITASGTVTANQGTPASTANRWPVQLSDGTDLALVSTGGALLVDGSATTQPVSGTVTVTQGTASNLNATVTGTVAATQSGTWNINNVSGTVSLPTGAATAANQTTVGNQTTKINDGTDTALVTAAGALVVDGSGSTQPVSGTVTANAGTGTFTTNVAQVGGNTVTTGSGAAGTGTQRVILATDQPVIPVSDNGGSITVDGTVAATQSGGWTVTANAGTNLNTSALFLDATFTGRFMSAAAAADNTANPTTTGVMTFGMLWDGATWDRMLGNSTDGLLVNLGANNDVSLNAGTNYIGKTRVTDGTLDMSLLNSAPGSDTGQVSIPVRIISSLAGGAGGTSSSYGSAFPAIGTAAGFTDGTNMQGARVFDADTGAGAQYVIGTNLRVSASGGSTEAAAGAGATNASTLRVVLPTDQTSIPVTQSGSWSLAANQSVNVAQVGGNAITTGSGASSTGTQRVILATDQSTIPINDNGGSITVDGTVAVSGTVTVSGTVDITELPTAAALADATANPTTTSVGALGLLYNGTTWDRMRGDTTNGLLVNVSDSFLLDATFTGRFAAGAALSDNFANPTTTQVGAMSMLWDGATWDRTPGTSTDGMLVNLGTNNDVTVTNATAANLRAQTASEGTTGSAVPSVAGVVGYTDGTNTRIPHAFDMDTSGSAIYVAGSAIVTADFGAATPVTGQQNSSGANGLIVYDLRKIVKTPTTTAVTCATTATLAPTSALSNRLTITLINNSSVTIYIGGSGVTTSNGLPLAPGASFTDDVEDSPYYCRVASGTADLRVLEN